MNDIKESIIRQCLDLFQRKDVRVELQHLVKPILNMLLRELYPYIIISIMRTRASFILLVGIILILIRNRKHMSYFTFP
jgi:hypothetical protein